MLVVEKFVCECFGAGVPEKIANLVRLIYNAIRIGVPIILIIVGMFDMGKAVTQQKEDEIKKAQQLLVKKAVAAGLVFLIFSLVTLILQVVDKDAYEGNIGCIRCILAASEDRTITIPVSTNHVNNVPSNQGQLLLSFGASNITLKKGETKELYLTITPPNVSNKSVTFIKSNNSIASFSESKDANGYKIKITALKEGSVTYSAVSNANNSIRASVVITVINKDVLTLNKSNIFVGVNGSETITSSLNNTKWTSNNKNIVEVVDGKVTGKAVGTTKIVATVGTQKAEVNVYVIGIVTSSKIISVGETSRLNASIKMEGNSSGLELKWSIESGSAYLRLQENGTITGISPGTAKVKVTVYNGNGSTGISSTINVFIRKQSSSITLETRTLDVGQPLVFTIENIYSSDCSIKNIEIEEKNNNKKFNLSKFSTTMFNGSRCIISGIEAINDGETSLKVKLKNSDEIFDLNNILIYASIDISKIAYVYKGGTAKINCGNCIVKKINDNSITMNIEGKGGTYYANLTIEGKEPGIQFDKSDGKNIVVMGSKIGKYEIVKRINKREIGRIDVYVVDSSNVCKDDVHQNGDLIELSMVNIIPSSKILTTSTFFYAFKSLSAHVGIMNIRKQLNIDNIDNINCSDFAADILGFNNNNFFLVRQILSNFNQEKHNDYLICDVTLESGGFPFTSCADLKLYSDSIKVYYVKK